jgi:hypothetical protein
MRIAEMLSILVVASLGKDQTKTCTNFCADRPKWEYYVVDFTADQFMSVKLNPRKRLGGSSDLLLAVAVVLVMLLLFLRMVAFVASHHHL